MTYSIPREPDIPQPRFDWKAVASLLGSVAAVLSWFIYWLPPGCGGLNSRGWAGASVLFLLAALCLGHWSRRNIRRFPGRLIGKGAASMGVLCSYALLFLMFLSMPDERKPQDAHESMAVANLRLIGAAETAYASKGRGYADIPSLIAADLLDSRFAAPISCYELKVTASENDYNATAIPISSDAGRFAYYNSPDGIVRYSKTMSLAPAGYAGKPVE